MMPEVRSLMPEVRRPLKRTVTNPIVLVVDDDECFLSIVEDFLDGLGFECILASDSAQARGYLSTTRYDAVISNANVPGESGLDLLRHICSEHPDTPFIVVTGTYEPRMTEKSERLGALCCLEKPFSQDDLLGSLTRALDHKTSFSEKRIQLQTH